MRRRWILGTVAVGMFASMLMAKPGVVTTRDGDKFSGDVTETDKFVTIDLHNIKTRVDKRNVASIEYSKTLDEVFADRRAALAADDVQGRLAIANWAMQNSRADLAVQILEEARKIDPLNRQAAQQLDAARQQVQMDSHPVKTGGEAVSTNTSATQPATQPVPTAPIAVKAEPPVHRLLTNDEVNIIRQQEMMADDKVRVQFTNDVLKEYLASGDHDAAAFGKLTPIQKATQIFSSGDSKMANDVRILTDPAPMLEFKQKIYPIIASGCAAAGCHGGTHGGTFGLYPGDSMSAIYSNFYILTTYAKTINGTQYVMLDRTLPERSLFFEFALPSTQTDVAHPDVPNYRPRFRSKSDPFYLAVLDWLTNSIKPIPPDYHINVAAKLPEPGPTPGAGTK